MSNELTHKEAIELLMNDQLLDECIIKSYVTLLKRGEAMEKMWEAVFTDYKVAETDNHYSDNKTKKKIKLNLEQKYLKEV